MVCCCVQSNQTQSINCELIQINLYNHDGAKVPSGDFEDKRSLFLKVAWEWRAWRYCLHELRTALQEKKDFASNLQDEMSGSRCAWHCFGRFARWKGNMCMCMCMYVCMYVCVCVCVCVCA